MHSCFLLAANLSLYLNIASCDYSSLRRSEQQRMPLTTSNNITRTQSPVFEHCTYPGHHRPIYCEHDRAPEQPPSIDRFDPKLSANIFRLSCHSDPIHTVDSILTWYKPQTMHVLRLSIVRLLLSSRVSLHSTLCRCCCRFCMSKCRVFCHCELFTSGL